MSNPLERLFRQFDSDDNDDGQDPFYPSPRMFVHHHPFATIGGSSYQIHEDGDQVSVEVEMPGVAAKDLKVEVWQPNPNSCVVQWSGQKSVGRGPPGHKESQQQQQQQPVQFSNRLRFGPQVDCDQVAANLSRGILWLTAPVKAKTEDTPQTRSIPIQEDP
jgi:HSP20 family molecular chaperone IbpA